MSNMTLPETLGLVSGILLIGGYIPYIYEVLKGTDIPNRASWFIWSLSTAVILVGVRETGTNEAIWVPIADAIGCFIIFILSIRHGEGGWAISDKISLGVALVSLIIWWFTGDPLIALLTNLLIYISGYISTIKKSIRNPESESFSAWTLFFLGVIFNLVTVIIGTDTGFEIWLYPIVLVGTVGTLYFFLIRKFARKII